MIAQALLQEWLSYNSESGVFAWRKSYRNQRLGKPVGSYDGDGYLVIKFRQRLYRAHRLAWLYVHGRLPTVLDHVDGCRSNNAIANLREVTEAGNSQNQRRAHIDSTHGLLGVDYNKRKGRFRARICTNGKRITLGGFATAQEAHAAYLAAKRAEHVTCTI